MLSKSVTRVFLTVRQLPGAYTSLRLHTTLTYVHIVLCAGLSFCFTVMGETCFSVLLHTISVGVCPDFTLFFPHHTLHTGIMALKVY